MVALCRAAEREIDKCDLQRIFLRCENPTPILLGSGRRFLSIEQGTELQ